MAWDDTYKFPFFDFSATLYSAGTGFSIEPWNEREISFLQEYCAPKEETRAGTLGACWRLWDSRYPRKVALSVFENADCSLPWRLDRKLNSETRNWRDKTIRLSDISGLWVWTLGVISFAKILFRLNISRRLDFLIEHLRFYCPISKIRREFKLRFLRFLTRKFKSSLKRF